MRILIPLDGSPLAEHALAPAVMLAKHLQPPANITLVRVAHYPSLESGMAGMYPGVNSATLIDDVLEVASDYLKTTAQSPLFQGMQIHTIAEIGVPAQNICTIAQSEPADLIIMTSHGRTGLGKLVLGSVAEAVVRDAHIPVLIMRLEGETFPDVGRFTPLTILVPLDGTPLSEAAIAPAATLARAFHGAIYLVRILPSAPNATDVTPQEAYAYLTMFHDRLTQEGLTVHRSLGWGDPATEIVAKAQEHHADMVAIATHARTPLAQLVQGSVAATVLHHVTLPMLIVHPAPTQEAAIVNTRSTSMSH